MFVRLKSAWFSMEHQMRSVFAYSQHCARPKKNNARNASESGRKPKPRPLNRVWKSM